jgi:hypothetical protein
MCLRWRTLFGHQRCMKAHGRIHFNSRIQLILMLGGTMSKLCCHVALLVIAIVFVASTLSTAAAAAGVSVLVDPLTGDDSSCAATFICRTIAYAVEQVGASQVNLSAGVFNESTVNINNAVSLFVIGVASASFFDCSRRLEQNTGAAFNISNSTVMIMGVTFQHCQQGRQRWRRVSSRQQRHSVALLLHQLQCSQRWRHISYRRRQQFVPPR